jgi:hypothetical protein
MENRWLSLVIGSLVLVLAATLFRPHSMRAPATLSESKPLSAPTQTYIPSDRARDLHLSVAGRMLSAKAVSPDKPATAPTPATIDRKIIRTGFLEALVKSPAETAEQIHKLAEGMGGYVESSQISSAQSTPIATITVRIPADRFEDAKAEIRKFATRIETEKTDANDVTKQYVDLQARIRNLRAEEAQYLAIMKSAAKVPDMLDVSEKLSEVRGEIEQQQAEFLTLSKQVETVAITVSLRSEPIAPVAELHWRPLYQIKLAWHDALDGLSDYANTMLGVILYIPVVILWVVTFVLGVAAVWKLLRWGARAFFAFPKPVEAVSKT